MPYRRKRHAPTVLCLVALILGCGDETTEPQTGSIQASLIIVGAAPDADGCLISVDDANVQQLLDGESRVFGDLPTGTHTVTISDVAFNCFVQGEAFRSVTVSANVTTEVQFAVDCPAPGSIEVVTDALGLDLDPDGYVVVLDGITTLDIGVRDSETFEDLPVGEHVVELTGVAENCSVTGDNPITVIVPENEAARAYFHVACPPLDEPRTGSIRVDLTIDGSTPDADGCLVSVDGTDTQQLLDGESRLFEGLSAGTHTVTVTDLADNCFVQGGSSRSVSVSANGTTHSPITLDCAAPGSIEVVTETIGSALDPDGYVVVLDGITIRDIGSKDGVSFEDVPFGQYMVELTGLADNCGVIGENPTDVTIRQGQGATIDFNVACPPFFDYIAFTSYEGISVMKEDGSIPVSVTAHLDLEHVAYLDWSPDGTRLAYRVYGNEGYDIQVMRVDGSEPVSLGLPPLFCVHSLEWSPDGNRLAFSGGEENHDVVAVEADGSDLVNLTNSAGSEWGATWSPDGSQIMFARYGLTEDTEHGLYVMDADGSNATFLSEHTGGTDLQWSPDGNRVLYNGMCGTDAIFMQICSMNPDGSNPVALTDPPDNDWHPAWSPDGTRIAFNGRRAETGIFVMNADGSDVSFLVEGGQPAWSPGQ